MIIVGNGKLVTRDAQNTFLEDGAVALDGARIAGVGATAALRRAHPDAAFIDAKGGLIMPGLINVHNHIYSAFARGSAIQSKSPKGFLDVLEDLWWKLDRALTLEDVTYSAWWTYIDGIKNGCTTVFDHHASFGAIEGSLFAISQVAEALGLRTCLCYEVSDRAGEEKMKAAVLENERFLAYARDKALQTGMMGLHASFTLSDASLEFARAHTPEDAGFHIHVAEGMADVYDCLRKYNKRVLQRLLDMDILGPKTIAGHCIHISPLEMDILRETDTIVAHNPESNMGNAVGCPPTLKLMRRGILCGLGTDGYTNDMFESMKVMNMLHKHHLCDPATSWAQPPQALFAANPQICARFFDTPVGALVPGAAADVIVVEYIPQTPMTAENIDSHLLFGVNGRCVTTTIASGKILMRDRELLVADEAALMARSRELCAALLKRL